MRQDARDATRRPHLPAGALLLAATGCWSVAALWVYSQPVAVGGQARFLMHYALPTLALLWTVRLVWIIATRGRRPRRQWALVATPILVPVTGLLIIVDAPFHTRWALSRPAFEQSVSAIRACTTPGHFIDQNLGAYRIRAMSPRAQGDIFFTTWWNGMSATGLVWHDSDLAERFEHYRLHHLGGNWYRFEYPS